MDPKEYVRRLKDISLIKLSLLNEILLFVRSQNEVIKGQRFEEMDLLIKEKQKRMDAVDKLDEQFAAYSSKLKEILSIDSFEELPGYNLPGTQELRDVIESIHQKLQDIKEVDDENISLVKTEMKDIREQINNTSNNKRVQGAYYPSRNSVTSYYFDEKK
jgi:methyl-accepting chemotaxis protein